MTPLETRLTAALAEDVARFERVDHRDAPQPDPQLPDPQLHERGLVSLRQAVQAPSRRRRSVLVGVAAAALIVLAVAAIAARRNDDTSGSDVTAAASSTTSVSPTTPTTSIATSSFGAQAGVEQPLVETAPSGVREVAKPGSAHGFSVMGHPDLAIWTSLEPNIMTGQVEESQCVSEAGGSGCGPTSMPAVFGQTSSIDNRVATDDLFTWSNLPADVATVGYDDGVVQQWQRPVAGLAIFRVDPNHPHPDIKAFDSSGTALSYSFWGPNPATTTNSTALSPWPNLSGETWGEVDTLTQSSLRDCMSNNGATWAIANVPTFSANVDPMAVWESCTVEVKSIVAARVAELAKGG